uniref:Innexin n=1 Tax=Meloidogyne incognita TaxID=6306 RepID=A0A914KL18_MELIC
MDILIDFVSQFIQNRHEDDHFDRLNYQITPFLFVLLSLVNISKLYIGSAINCFAKAEFKEGWVQYTNDYCLVENTYYIRSDERIPLQKELRNRERIAYYQASCNCKTSCSFYIPHLIWRSFNWLSGFQVKAVVSASKEVEQQTNDEITKIIAKSLFHASQQQHQPICFVQKQHFVGFLFLTMKLAYVLLICFHLCLFKFFIGNIDFAIGILDHKGEWRQSGNIYLNIY